MKPSDTIRVLAECEKKFPGAPIPEDTAKDWAADLVEFEYEDAIAALNLLKRRQRWRPAINEMLATTTEVRRDRLMAQPALPSGGDLIEDAPSDEVAAILRGYFDHIGLEEEARSRLNRAARRGDPEAKIEAGRLIAQAQILREKTGKGEGEEGPVADSRPSPFPQRSACGVEWGTRNVLINGVACCPNCHSPKADGCTSVRDEASA